ncbi:MAG: GH32 C-terminal domain-containing protein [Oscillospiraceae bacterium]|nr:GH32 C-terminal domain-containing protein [Oscillospiraceae bacterium]
MYTKNNADEYIQNNKNKVNHEFKPEFHFTAEIGWINDPNGFCRFGGKYHLFYQFYPYSSKEGPKHWGHAISHDLIKWEHLPVALAPDCEFDKDGCWSGTALALGDVLYLIYTGVHDGKQEQCIAFSTDGVNFEKYAHNPVIGEKNLAPGVNIQDFRDPKIIKRGESFYCIIGANSKAVVYKSKADVFAWEYVGDLLDKQIGVMWECPDYFEEDGEAVFIASVCGENQENKDEHKFTFFSNPTYFMLESDDFDNLPLKYKSFGELEGGFDFYAPQTVSNPENKNIIIAWMYTFGERIITDADNLDHNWSHCMTLPREISAKNGILYQNPVKSIEKYRQNEIIYKNFNSKYFGVNFKKCCEILILADITNTKKLEINLPAGTLEFDFEKGLVVFDRTNHGYDMRSDEWIKKEERDIKKSRCSFADTLDLRIFVDVSTIEIFVNGGEKVISTRFYSKDIKENHIGFRPEGEITIKELKQYDIVMNEDDF